MRKPAARHLFCFASLLLLAFLATGCRKAEANLNAKPHIAEPQPAQAYANLIHLAKNPDAAPAFQLKDLEGNPVTLDAAKGKIVILNFWATWCGPCRAEIPDLIELQSKYKDQLEIIAPATDEDDAEAVKKFVTKSGINYRVAMASNELRAQYGGIPALPTSFIIDAQGRVVQKHVGLNDPTIYELEVRALLGLPVDAKVDYFEDSGQIFLKNAERATEFPGVDLSHLTPEQKKIAIRRFNSESCTCNCRMTLAQCRINDAGCGISKAMTAKIIASLTAKPAATTHKTSPAPQQ